MGLRSSECLNRTGRATYSGRRGAISGELRQRRLASRARNLAGTASEGHAKCLLWQICERLITSQGEMSLGYTVIDVKGELASLRCGRGGGCNRERAGSSSNAWFGVVKGLIT